MALVKSQLKETSQIHLVAAFAVGLIVGSIGTFMLLGATAQNGHSAVQHYGPHPNPPGLTDEEKTGRTSLVAVGHPACETGKWLDVRSTDPGTGLYGRCSSYPGDLQLRVVDYSFVGKGLYLARIGLPKCSSSNLFEPHSTTACIPYLPLPETVNPLAPSAN